MQPASFSGTVGATMPAFTSLFSRAVTAAVVCAAVGALPGAALAQAGAPPDAPPKRPSGPAFVFSGFTTVKFDPALMASVGIVVEPRGSVRPGADGGLRYKIYDGRTTLKFPLKSTILSAGNAGLRQASSGSNLNFTDFTVKLGRAKSVLSAKSGEGIGYGGPRQTLLRIAPLPENVIVDEPRLQVLNVPITLTATGTTVFNTLFGAGLPAPPFALGQTVGTLNVKTKYYYRRAATR